MWSDKNVRASNRFHRSQRLPLTTENSKWVLHLSFWQQKLLSNKTLIFMHK
jgi:hypothetical protein